MTDKKNQQIGLLPEGAMETHIRDGLVLSRSERNLIGSPTTSRFVFDGNKPEHQLVIETTNGTELILDEATVNKLCDALDRFLLTGLCS